MASRKSVPMPQTIEQVDELVGYIGELRRQINGLNDKLADDIKTITKDIGAEVTKLEEERAAAEKAVTAYAETHRIELTNDGKEKTVKLRSGRLRWYLCKPSVLIEKGKEKTAAEFAYKDPKLRRFVQVGYSLVKNTLVKEPELAAKIPGVIYRSGEERFSIDPNESQAETIRQC
jgi:phage host-nuclease inhibitor protein Gam